MFNVFRRDVMGMVRKNRDHQKAQATYAMFMGDNEDQQEAKRLSNQLENIIDIRLDLMIYPSRYQSIDTDFMICLI